MTGAHGTYYAVLHQSFKEGSNDFRNRKILVSQPNFTTFSSDVIFIFHWDASKLGAAAGRPPGVIRLMSLSQQLGGCRSLVFSVFIVMRSCSDFFTCTALYILLV